MINGIFIRELKNRFRCQIKIGEKLEICYVPSSCRLSNFANFSGCKVLLNENNKSNSQIKYSLYAIKYQRKYLLVNLKEANRIVYENLSSRRFGFLGKRSLIKKEFLIENYRSDFYINDTKTVIEVKSILALSQKQPLPIVYSERAIQQLKIMKKLLQMNYKVYYFFISMYPNNECLYLENDGSEYAKLFVDNFKSGMNCRAYAIDIKNDNAILKSEIKVIID